jgi:dTDP-4-dehydrorhamnose reductase
MKILVTGGQGQLARSLFERGGLHSDMEIIAVGRPKLDLAIAGSASDAIAAIRPDIVINTAAYTNVDKAEDEPELAFRINAQAAGEVAAASALIGAPIIQISTDYVFDGESTEPYTEDCETNPLGVYGRSKLEGEERVKAANRGHMIVRAAWVYSPFGKNFVKTMMEAAKTRDVLTVVDDQVGSPSSALDLADGLLRAVQVLMQSDERGLAEVYHLVGTGTTSWCGLAQFVMDECRKHALAAAEVRPIRTADWPTKARRPANSVLDSGKFARDFGFVMPDWHNSLPAIVARLGTNKRID